MISFFIPIRSGSKRIKDKNTRSLPSFSFGLIEIKIKQIQKFRNLVKKFKIKQDFEYIVSTNCIKTIKFLKNYKWIKVHNRSKKLSMDDSLDDLIKILPGICNGNFILWTHVTSPFFDQYEYINFIKNFLRGKFNSAFSADLIQKFIYNHKKKWISHKSNKKKWPRTQDLDPMYVANSGAFIAKRKIYLKDKNRICKNPLPIITPKAKGFDVDDINDFKYLKEILKRGQKII
mgnify:FL=1